MARGVVERERKGGEKYKGKLDKDAWGKDRRGRVGTKSDFTSEDFSLIM